MIAPVGGRTRSADQWLLGGILVVAVAVRLIAVGRNSLWLDEAFSVFHASQPLSAIWSWASPVDFAHPPGFHTFLKAWNVVSEAEWWVRLPSVLAGTATVAATYLIGKRVSGTRVGLLAAAIVALSPFAVLHSRDARMYALLTLAAAGVIWAVLALLDEPRSRRPTLVYILSMVSALYLHNLGLLIGVAASLAVIAGSRGRDTALLRRWVLTNIAVLIAWLPWIPGLINQVRWVSDDFWIARPDARAALAGTRHIWASDSLPGSALLAIDVAAIGLAVAGIVVLRNRKAAALGAFWLLTPALLLSYSLVARPVYLPRTFSWVIVPLAVLMAVAILRLGKPGRLAALSAVAVVSLAGVAQCISDPGEPWDSASQFVTDVGVEDGDVMLFQADYGQIPFNHYFATEAAVEQVRLPPLEGPEDWAEVFYPAEGRERVWLVYHHHLDFVDPAYVTHSTLQSMGFEATSHSRFSNQIEVYLFEVTT